MPDSRAPLQDIDRVASALVACLPALHRGLERRVGQEFPHPRLPDGQLALLFLVEERRGITVREAAEALLMKPNNVSALVSQLTDQDLLERRQDPADKRVAHLHPTATARERLAEARLLKEEHLARALRTLTDGDLDALGAALGALESLAGRLHPAG
ncbi:MarR family winged helix-turn-helix transcriptional regulator [Streptomyces nitrosporeus]|uniref:MarR family transcriptional regulator n=1 Tax=Streptomyces nitrosporeus TaxID=28894 RepID=A0A5J6F5H8_9ACTN|nr:MarR family transcriptional regulator [Streptomyces nitrosporeus]QEU71511.1 MarR family transcriptional regulator [Streptomyces nitrosporeus]GGZ11013.1 MarR family transcriptional regulator [Streptomyces nitrosporeus]